MCQKQDFSSAEKEKAFDAIADLYYNRNFGTMTKADFETLLFSIYLEHLLDNHLPCDDYTMSIALGVSETRIRTLKERKQLKYPRAYCWQKAFAKLVLYAKYDEVTKLVKMPIEDVNLMKEVRHFIQQNGWYDEFSRNPRLFQCKLDYFLLLCSKLDGEIVFTDSDKQKLRELEANEDERSAIEKILDHDFEDGFKELVA
ncbi:MAG: hypothetical protein LUF89_09380 [Ruminococcus sp.]|nr:hypothetical protein [Ruminococcus sp.]